MPPRRRIFLYLAVLAVIAELGVDLFVFIWGFSHIFKGDGWGWQPALASGLRGTLILLAAHLAFRGYRGARIAIVVFDSIQAALMLPMSFVAFAINADNHGVRNFLFMLAISTLKTHRVQVRATLVEMGWWFGAKSERVSGD